MSRPSSILLVIEFTSVMFILAWISSADIVHHTLHVYDVSERKLCKDQVITTVNGTLPGPTIYAREGDTLIVHVVNKSPHNMTIHWHGVIQWLSCWADGPDYITQCPIMPGNSYTYRFNVTGQEGTLFYHAHSSFFRATVHGALVVRPKLGNSYPFPEPNMDFPIILGEWYNESVTYLEKQITKDGFGPDPPEGHTINGLLGDFYSCSHQRRFLDVQKEGQYSTLEFPLGESGFERDIYTIRVTRGKTYLLRIIGAMMNINMYFMIANHNMTVVAVDASYTNPYPTNVVTVSPGQTIDVLFEANQPSSYYYMAALSYHIQSFLDILHPTATALLVYDDVDTTQSMLPVMPNFPDYWDIETAVNFSSSLTALVTSPFWSPVPLEIDEHMFMTIGLGIVHCNKEDRSRCLGPLNQLTAASINNVSFQSPTETSILEAYFNKEDGAYTTDFPNRPPVMFNFTNLSYIVNEKLMWTQKATKVKKLKYNATVEIVFQGLTFVNSESHPMHLHGHNFNVLAQGFGNYDPSKDRVKFNLVNPQVRNTIAVPMGGWAAIRFQANNPGAWYIHCHMEPHLAVGLGTIFLVENGPTTSTTLPPPPTDLPRC